MQRPHLKTNDYPAIRLCTGQSGGEFELEGYERVVEQVDQPDARGPEIDDEAGNARHFGGETESAFGNLERTVELEPGDCIGYIIDNQNIVARTRLGLTLLLLFQDAKPLTTSSRFSGRARPGGLIFDFWSMRRSGGAALPARLTRSRRDPPWILEALWHP